MTNRRRPLRSGPVRTKLILALLAALLATPGLPAAAAEEGDPVAPQADPDAEFVPASEDEEPRPSLDLVKSGFSLPVMVDAPLGDDRLFVVELTGKIKIIENGTVLATPFLSLTVGTSGEQGLYGMAFHPAYNVNGRFYVHYANTSGDNRVVEYKVSSNPNVAGATPVKTIAAISQPYTNHNGGAIEFGPDGLLYVAIGDGGSSGDPDENGQNPHTLLGTVLRFDPDISSPYIPSSNPFANGVGGSPAVYHYGLRNPWRMAHDPATGELYIADVGQNTREEVTVLPAGAEGEDLGWNTFEGTFCFESHPTTGCSQAGTVFPTIEYSHGSNPCSGSITGGYVYRGYDYPDLDGHYFYADYCKGWVKSFRAVGGVVKETNDWTDDFGFIEALGFGTGGDGQLYITTAAGSVYEIVGTPGPRLAGDFTGDGKIDVADYDSPTKSWQVQRSTGSSFTEESWGSLPAGPGFSTHLVGDVDGDGKDDVASYRPADGTWWVSRSTGSGFTITQWADFSTNTGWAEHLIGDFNGDGKADLASFHPSNGTWWVSESSGSGFTTLLWADFSTASGWSKHLAGDFDNDGNDDLASFHPSNGTWWVSESDGDDFTTRLWADFATATGWGPQFVGDFNGDGRDDIANYFDGNGTWWISRSNGSVFTTLKWADFITATGWQTHVVGDFTGDGKDDIGSFHPANGTWWISEAQSNTFTTVLWADFATASGWSVPNVGDVDDDGDDDIVNYFPGNDSWWVSVSSGTSFTTPGWG